jgi:beta-carotene 3-hydroxylase
MLLNALIVLLTFLAMEGVAWTMHRYVLHGPLWFLHRSHHVRHDHAFERNDFFFLFYGSLATVFFILGSENFDWRFWVATGVTLYGLVYFLVHDLFIHQRVRLFGKTGNRYLKALDMAHKVHHKYTEPEGGEAFGMLLVPKRFFQLANRKKQTIQPASSGQNASSLSNS